MRPLDIAFMKAVHHKVNIVPVIAKADTLTKKEVLNLKRRVSTFNPFRNNGISHKSIYNSQNGPLCIYIEGSQVIITQKYFISFAEDRFYRSKQCRPL